MDGTVNIYSQEREKELVHFWSGMVFHPTDAIEDEWGQRIIKRISRDRAVKSVRIYTMMEDIFTLDKDGNLNCDFTLNDFRLDCLLAGGFDIALSYAFIPPWPAADARKTSSVAKGKTRYKGKMIVASYAKDEKKWEEICRRYTEHIVERYGEEVVSQWRIQCYNEPNLDLFFMAGEEDGIKRCEEYCRLYDGFEAGITAVSRKLRIGGPALADVKGYSQFLEQFLEHVRKKGKKLDFISFHSYGTTPDEINRGEKHLNVRNSLETIQNIVRIGREQGFGNLPLICDEWGAVSAGFYNVEECPALWFRETELFSAYFVKMLTLYDEIGLPLEKMMICLSGQHEMLKDFSGFRNFFTLNFYPKPIYNAHILCERLGNSKLRYESDLFKELSVMPTWHEDGHISILLGYSDDGFERELEDAHITLNMEEIRDRYEVKLYIIDKLHSNAWERYCRLGKPECPTEEQKRDIREFAVCRPVEAGIVTPENPQVLLTMTDHSVILVELFPL